jgi:hypothetical protein
MTKEQSEELKAPSAPLPSNQADDLSACVKQFEGKTAAQISAAILPNVEPEFVPSLMCGLGVDMKMAIPDWAKKASRQFWKYYFGRELDLAKSVEDRGAFTRCMEAITRDIEGQQPTEPQHPFVAFIRTFGNPLVNALEKEARNKPPKAPAKFYVGRVRGEEAFEKIRNPEYLKMVKRAPIYFSLCTHWQKFKTFTSHAEAERWLRAEKIIDSKVNSREVSAVFTGVGLPSRGPGRPKNPKTDASNSANQDSIKS